MSDPSTSYTLQQTETLESGELGDDPSPSEIFRNDDPSDSNEDGEEFEITVTELLYSSSSYYAIAKPVTLTMVLSALAVVFINTEETVEKGEEAMSTAYQVFKTSNSGSEVNTFLFSIVNSLIMVTFICGMTFVIVLLYRYRCMKCLIGYMVFVSGTLLGFLGSNLLQTAVQIYHVSMDNVSFFLIMYNFALVGVFSVFWGQGVPKYVTQGYLIATSVILAWHLSYFDSWTTWCLLTMLALYDLCAVLTPCGPLKFLVDLMSKEDSPEMPGLLFEADLPPEARRPGKPPSSKKTQRSRSQSSVVTEESSMAATQQEGASPSPMDEVMDNRSVDLSERGRTADIPLAIATVYNLKVVSIPVKSSEIMLTSQRDSQSPLLSSSSRPLCLPDNPTSKQLRADVTVRLPSNGGTIERVARKGKKVYLETDRKGNPKRILWVDNSGKVFAEMRGDDEDFGDERNSIRLGMGDFIFYSVLVAKAAQYSFATFAACMLVILSGLGGTLVLLSVYHHALPALPISIFLGVFFYLVTRFFIEPWIEAVLNKPFYV